jgi:quercetin dioxygenase-like cupin family protein
MSEQIKQIATRIKELRTIADKSIKELAKEFKVTEDQYARYESGDVDIPVSFLCAVAQKFKVELTTLLTGGEPHLRGYCLVKKGAAPSVDRRKEYKYQDLAYNFVDKKAEVFLVCVDPKPKTKKVHYYSHGGQEFTYLLEGKLQVMLDGHEVTLEPGDSLYFNSGLRHAMAAIGGKPAKFLAVVL